MDQRLPEARALGEALSELLEEPEAFTTALAHGLQHLADPPYRDEQERVAPGSGPVIGVRWPLIHAIERQLRRPLAESSAASALWLAQRLDMAEAREVRLEALVCLRRSLPDDPERSWQLMRRIARAANDWITVDSLADLYARGILLEPFRWAELEQLIYSQHRMERRLVGSTLARLPHSVRSHDRSRLDTGRAMELVRSLMGDADDQVRKALSWALREWTRVDRAAVERTLAAETELAVATGDGHRAWVIRDSLSHMDPTLAKRLRARLEGVRRRPGAPSTSRASEVASAFAAPLALADNAAGLQGDRFARRGI